MTVYFNVTCEVPLTDEEKAEQKEKEKDSSTGSSGGPASSSSSSSMAAPPISVDVNPSLGRYYPSTKTVMVPLSEAQRAQQPPANGWITLTFDVPKEATQVNVYAWSEKPYKVGNIRKYLSKAKSPSDSYMQLQVGTEKPTVGTNFTVTVKSTDVLPELTYQIYAKGALLQTQVVPPPPNNGTSVEFSFMVTGAMTPSISLVAFYVRGENHEVVVDALSLSVNGLFQSSMSIEFSQTEAEPGDNIDVIVKAATDSLVYLLSADMSAILLKGGNDITQEDVTRDMAEYSFGGGFAPWNFMFICGWPSPFSGSDAASVLRNAGVIFLSDVLVYAEQYGSSGRFPSIADGGVAVPESVGGAVDQSTNNKIDTYAAEVVRKFFPEVWLWEISYITPEYAPLFVVQIR
ncbi:CD109 antigen-like [Elysia marginata]|uniref:CD109 antigen-like n=1 Tax=Elysia marginata TaxID=1093978 RepID=A0AAV4GRV2_9GAST|nr:CD109 antigen-like [Elysia marginata]